MDDVIEMFCVTATLFDLVVNITCGMAGHEWVRTRRPQASHCKTTSCLSHSMGGVHVLC